MTSKVPEYLPSVGRLLGFASAGCNTLTDRRLRKHGVTIQQWIPLSALWRSSPQSESDLAPYCRKSASSMNRLLDRMEIKRLVKRRRDPGDGRRVLVDLGREGRRLSHLLGFYEEINEVLLAGLSAKGRVQLIALLEHVSANIQDALAGKG